MDEDKKKEIVEILVQEEQKKPFTERRVQGDASETGLVKFVQPIMDIEQIR